MNAVKTASFKGLEEMLKRGIRPGSLVCIYGAKGRYLIGTHKRRQEMGVCKFPDGSMVGIGSLSYAARMNDKVSVK